MKTNIVVTQKIKQVLNPDLSSDVTQIKNYNSFFLKLNSLMNISLMYELLGRGDESTKYRKWLINI